MRTHRCDKSLEAEVSIRYDYMIDEMNEFNGDYKAWRLFTHEYDFEYNCFHSIHVAEIQYCPFCGKELR